MPKGSPRKRCWWTPAPSLSQGQRKKKNNQAKKEAPRVPSDQRLLDLHRDFVKRAEKLADEYERGKNFGKARVVYEEILKLAPSYRSAQQKLDEIRQRELSANNVNVRIFANKGWQPTGVYVVAGKPFRVAATGSWKFKLELELSPDGIQIPKELKDFNLGSLIGVINAGDPEDLKPFAVGVQKAMIAEQSGPLFLRMYDTQPDDNEGSLQVEISGSIEKGR